MCLSSDMADEWEYVTDRIDEARAAADISNDADALEDARLRMLRVRSHSSAPGGLVVSTERPKCAACGRPFPCAVLRMEARPWRDRGDFPVELLKRDPA